MKKQYYIPTLTISLLMLLTTFLGCKKEKDGYIFIDNMVYITFLDSAGNDLLNPNYSYDKSIDLKTLNIAYIINGKEQLRANLFTLTPPEGHKETYRIGFSLNIKDKATKTKTLLKWDNTSVDTLESNIIRKNNNKYIVCDQLNLNGKEVWNVNSSKTPRGLIITK